MTKRINRGCLPTPDLRGYVRPEVGGKRFIVGNIKDVGRSEMERRLADLRNLFERQCQYHEIDHWAGSVLPRAKKLAAGERLVLRVSDDARLNEGQASEEAQHLHELRELGLDVVADSPYVFARGEKELKQLIDSTVREALCKAMATADARFESFPSSLVAKLGTRTGVSDADEWLALLHEIAFRFPTVNLHGDCQWRTFGGTQCVSNVFSVDIVSGCQALRQ